MGGDPSGLSTLLSRSDILRNVLGLALAGGSFRGGAAVAQIGYPALPPLTGSFDTIGCRYTRVNGYATQESNPGLADPRQVLLLSRLSLASDSARAKIFYPASSPSSREAPYCTDGRATSDGMAGLVGFRSMLEMPSAPAAPCHLPDVADPSAFGCLAAHRPTPQRSPTLLCPQLVQQPPQPGSASSGSPFCSATSPTRPRAAGSRRHHIARRARCRCSATLTASAATWTWRRT